MITALMDCVSCALILKMTKILKMRANNDVIVLNAPNYFLFLL
jgi:hypothetical protein